jgi:hypothetical protein
MKSKAQTLKETTSNQYPQLNIEQVFINQPGSVNHDVAVKAMDTYAHQFAEQAVKLALETYIAAGCGILTGNESPDYLAGVVDATKAAAIAITPASIINEIENK